MKTKMLGTLLITGLVVLSAMVVFAPSALADDEPDPPEAPGITLDMLTDRTPEEEEDDLDPQIYGYITDPDGGVSAHVEVWKWLGHWVLKGEDDTDPATGYYYIAWYGLRLGWYALVIQYDGNTIVDGPEWLGWAKWKEDGTNWDYQWDYYIPEFATIAIPAVAILGLFLFFNHRKRKE